MMDIFLIDKHLIRKSNKMLDRSILINSMEILVFCSFLASKNKQINYMREAIGRPVYLSLSAVTLL